MRTRAIVLHVKGKVDAALRVVIMQLIQKLLILLLLLNLPSLMAALDNDSLQPRKIYAWCRSVPLGST